VIIDPVIIDPVIIDPVIIDPVIIDPVIIDLTSFRHLTFIRRATHNRINIKDTTKFASTRTLPYA